MNPYAKFGPDRPRRLADYKEHTYVYSTEQPQCPSILTCDRHRFSGDRQISTARWSGYRVSRWAVSVLIMIAIDKRLAAVAEVIYNRR